MATTAKNVKMAKMATTEEIAKNNTIAKNAMVGLMP